MDIIPPTAPIFLTSDMAFSSYVLIVDAYFKIPKYYVTEKISTEEVMGKLDMFQSRFGKNRQIWMVGLKNNFSRRRGAIYLDEFQRRMPNLRS